MNKQELIEHISNTLNERLRNTIYTLPMFSITESAKSNEVSLEFKIKREGIVLDRVPQKPVVKQFVADWYEKNKNNLDYNIWSYVYEWEDQEEDEFKNWFNRSNKAFQIIANMHQFGYEVENEKRYLVKIKGIDSNDRYLKRVRSNWIISESDEHKHAHIHTSHTRKQLEEAGFGEVFNSTLFEVKEAEEW